MKIYLMRHAESESGDRMDPTRALTDGGHKQAATMAEFMRRQVGTVDLIVTSVFKRAEDTGTPMAKALGCANVQRTPALDPDSTPVRAIAEVRRMAHGRKTVLVVTHHPLVGDLLEYLTHAKTDEVAFHHGHIAKVVEDRIHWFVGPKLVEREEAVTEAALALADAAIVALEGAALLEAVA